MQVIHGLVYTHFCVVYAHLGLFVWMTVIRWLNTLIERVMYTLYACVIDLFSRAFRLKRITRLQTFIEQGIHCMGCSCFVSPPPHH